MIEFHSLHEFEMDRESIKRAWIDRVLAEEKKELGVVNYIFCNDDYLHDINVRYLEHDTLTDIISFDYTTGDLISGDIYISTDRVKENAQKFKVHFDDELDRVMVHGILHYCGYKDKTKAEATVMRGKEDYYLNKR